MIRQIPKEDVQAVLELLALQTASYIVEARLIGYQEIPPLKDSPLTLRCSKETFNGYYLTETEAQGHSEVLAGAIAWERSGSIVTITRMMVHPGHFRKGIASQLMRHLLERHPDASKFVVSTSETNEPAILLYSKFGFRPSGARTIAPSVTLVTFARMNDISLTEEK
ncbi:GNAT family N-acetyltransferase [Paenibacillus lutrae]|uniref:GNAT family N-acetyltransferase n=1 Tax=Paenibacillus lutrae TaxID=2078573 RepID=A0A7X3K172_9BACL|nr:GNAT family N-acetyltransferase [Paenibacillus lutrae]MVP02004.1 GNAT family N-acetyltransferase [Paenibacillus lutrae]